MARERWGLRQTPALRNDIAGYWCELSDLGEAMPLDAIASAADLLLDCHARGRVVFVVGNGGSAATASHLACDLAKGTRLGGAPTFRVVPLTDNVPLLTAWANDTSYDRVFAEQLASLARPGDLLLAISASGNSPNVVAAAEAALEGGLTCWALTGPAPNPVCELADDSLCVDARATPTIQEVHQVVVHLLCAEVDSRLGVAPPVALAEGSE